MLKKELTEAGFPAQFNAGDEARLAKFKVRMEKQRVLITGVGIICAIGNNYKQFFAALEAGLSGVGRITSKHGIE